MREDEMAGWHHRLNGQQFKQAPGDGEGQGSLACCSPSGCKESDSTERLNNNNEVAQKSCSCANPVEPCTPKPLCIECRIQARGQRAGPCQFSFFTLLLILQLLRQPVQSSRHWPGISSSLCWILPAHHKGTGNDFLCLQLLSQPKPGPLTLSHQSTSDSRGLH